MGLIRIKRDKERLPSAQDSDGIPVERDGVGLRWFSWSDIVKFLRNALVSQSVGSSVTRAPSEQAVSNALESAGLALDGVRPIKALPYLGQVPGGENPAEVISNIYWPFLLPVINLEAFPLQEVGSSYAPQVTGTINPRDETLISERRVLEDGVSIHTFAGNNISFAAPAFTIALGDNKEYQVAAKADNSGVPKTILSDGRMVEGIYPYLIGSSTEGDLSGAALYNALDKVMKKEGDREVLYNGQNEYFYFCIHEDYTDLAKILDQNGFVQGGFLASKQIKAVTSANGWTQNYKVYRSELTTINNGLYKFNR